MKNKKIEKNMSLIDDLEFAKDKIQGEIEKLYEAIVHKDFPKIEAGNIYCPFTHECEKSPFGWCVYDAGRTVYPDVCIYCDEPEER